MANKKQSTPTNSRNLIAAVGIGILIVAFGVSLLLSGLGLFPVDLTSFWFPAVCVTLWLGAFLTGALRKESWTVWVGFVFFGLAVVNITHAVSGVGYGKLFPMYIAIPAVCSLVTLLFAQNKKLHLESIILFGGLTVIFTIQVLTSLNWFITAGIIVIMLGLFIFVNVATSKKGRWDDGDRPQRKRPE